MGKRVIIDLTGQKFGRLTVVRFLERKNKHSMFECLCECGNYIVVTSNNLRRNHTKSCGCLNIDCIVDRSSTHGLSSHPLYSIWNGMKNRCYYEGHNRHELYAEKGVIVCDEWKDDFKAFYDWAISNGWKRGLSIDRKDNFGIYSPDNCRIATDKIQSRNRTSNIKLTYNGVTRILIEWSESLNIPYHLVQSRNKRGWTPEEVLFGRKNK